MAELRLVLRTPSRVVFEGTVSAVRWPSPSGQVGLRPGAEPLVSALEPGLVLIRSGEARLIAGTAGGVARHDGRETELFSPFAAVGTAEEVLEALARARGSGEGELAALRHLRELEQRITVEVRAGLTRSAAP